MKLHTTQTNITKFIESEVLSNIENWMKILISGELKRYEKELEESLLKVFNYLGDQLLPRAALEACNSLKKKSRSEGCRKMEKRAFKLRISSGHQVKVESYYAKRVPDCWKRSRHSIVEHWKIIGNSSPGLYDKVGFCAALGPSYDVGRQTLNKFGVNICLSSVRDITNNLSTYCYTHNEEDLMVEQGESLKDKRVVISIDGGRTRTRTYRGKRNKNGNSKFATNWREPKLFVIDVLDEHGKPDRYKLPIYGCRFGKKDAFKLLSRYLKKLEIKEAKLVQILGDGASWIWNNMKSILIKLGVNEKQIVETLDYYHSSSYVHELVEKMPRRISKQRRKKLLKEFKEQLWAGESYKIIQTCQKIYLRPSKIIKRWLKYLGKHNDKTQYLDYQEDKLMCGSGIIESAIRRVINLRFKNASTFWDKKRVEKMYFLRGALLAKRWEFVISNIVNRGDN